MSLLVVQLGCLSLAVGIYLFVGLLVALCMNRIQVLWNLSVRNFSIIGVQCVLYLSENKQRLVPLTA